MKQRAAKDFTRVGNGGWRWSRPLLYRHRESRSELALRLGSMALMVSVRLMGSTVVGRGECVPVFQWFSFDGLWAAMMLV